MTDRITPDGARITATYRSGGYSGSTDYVIEGEIEAVTAAIAGIKARYPPPGYGTWFNWPPPPDGPKVFGSDKPVLHLAPRETAPGVWQARGYHSNSCD